MPRQQMVDAPLGWEPVFQRLFRGTVNLLDVGPVVHSADFRVPHPGVLGNFAEEVLTVNKLERIFPTTNGTATPAVQIPAPAGPVTSFMMLASLRPPKSLKHLWTPSSAPGPGTTNSISEKSQISL